MRASKTMTSVEKEVPWGLICSDKTLRAKLWRQYNYCLVSSCAPVAQRLEQQTHNPNEALTHSCTSVSTGTRYSFRYSFFSNVKIRAFVLDAWERRLLATGALRQCRNHPSSSPGHRADFDDWEFTHPLMFVGQLF